MTAPALTVPSRPRLIIRSTSGRARTRSAGLRARRRLDPRGPWPRRASTRHHSPSGSKLMIRRSSRRRNRRSTAPTPPGQNLGIFRYRARSHEFTTSLLDIFHGGVQCHNHVNHQDRRPQPSPRRTSNSARSRPTTTRRRRCDSSPSAPSAAASRRSST